MMQKEIRAQRMVRNQLDFNLEHRIFDTDQWHRCKKQNKMIKVDRNEAYGLYYTEDGERIDHRVIEISHTNDYYNKWVD